MPPSLSENLGDKTRTRRCSNQTRCRIALRCTPSTSVLTALAAYFSSDRICLASGAPIAPPSRRPRSVVQMSSLPPLAREVDLRKRVQPGVQTIQSLSSFQKCPRIDRTIQYTGFSRKAIVHLRRCYRRGEANTCRSTNAYCRIYGDHHTPHRVSRGRSLPSDRGAVDMLLRAARLRQGNATGQCRLQRDLVQISFHLREVLKDNITERRLGRTPPRAAG